MARDVDHADRDPAIAENVRIAMRFRSTRRRAAGRDRSAGLASYLITSRSMSAGSGGTADPPRVGTDRSPPAALRDTRAFVRPVRAEYRLSFRRDSDPALRQAARA